MRNAEMGVGGGGDPASLCNFRCICWREEVILFAIVVYYLVLACNGHLSNLWIYIFGNKNILCVRYFILFAAFYTICQLFFPHLKFSVKSCNTVFDIDAIQDYHPNRKQYASTLRLWQLHIRVNCCKYLVVRRSRIIG